MPALPDLIVHADWGSDSKKRQMCVAQKGSSGTFHLGAPEPVGELDTFWQRIHQRAGSKRVLAGFDFPIGVPATYAKAAGIADFRLALNSFGEGKWATFYDVARSKEDISIHQPFYPNVPDRTTKQSHLLEGLGVTDISQLLRRCEQASQSLRAASPLFWTVGSKQVGKAAIIGWRDIIVPGMQAEHFDLKIWPFDGNLHGLLGSDASVVVETYPAAACVQLGLDAPGQGTWKKGDSHDLRRLANRILEWPDSLEISFSNALVHEIKAGFEQGDDAFDAAIGLFGMLDVVLGDRNTGVPDDDTVRGMEGWIFGRQMN